MEFSANHLVIALGYAVDPIRGYILQGIVTAVTTIVISRQLLPFLSITVSSDFPWIFNPESIERGEAGRNQVCNAAITRDIPIPVGVIPLAECSTEVKRGKCRINFKVKPVYVYVYKNNTSTIVSEFSKTFVII